MSSLPPPPPSSLPPPQSTIAGGATNPVDLTPAPLGRRFGALAIDLALAALSITGLFTLVINGLITLFNLLGTANDPYYYEEEPTKNLGGFLPVFVIVGVVWLVASGVLWRMGTSPGKKALGLHVVDVRTGTAIGFGRMFSREVISKALISAALSGIPLLLGIIMIVVTKKRRGYWDMMAGTIVVKRN